MLIALIIFQNFKNGNVCSVAVHTDSVSLDSSDSDVDDKFSQNLRECEDLVKKIKVRMKSYNCNYMKFNGPDSMDLIVYNMYMT